VYLVSALCFAYAIAIFHLSSPFHVNLLSLLKLVNESKKFRNLKIELVPQPIIYDEISGYIVFYKVIDFPLQNIND
jgi:hypothetical protein